VPQSPADVGDRGGAIQAVGTLGHSIQWPG